MQNLQGVQRLQPVAHAEGAVPHVGLAEEGAHFLVVGDLLEQVPAVRVGRYIELFFGAPFCWIWQFGDGLIGLRTFTLGFCKKYERQRILGLGTKCRKNRRVARSLWRCQV